MYDFFTRYQTAAIVGSRSGFGQHVADWILPDLRAAGVTIYTTCGDGAPATAAPYAARVWRADDYAEKPLRARFALRAQAMIRTLARQPAPLLIAFTDDPRPAWSPRRTWQPIRRTGSGTWSEILMAYGHGIDCLLYGTLPGPDCHADPINLHSLIFWHLRTPAHLI